MMFDRLNNSAYVLHADLPKSEDPLDRFLLNMIRSSKEPPFQYLINCYHRSDEIGKKLSSMKDTLARSELEDLVRHIKKLIVRHYIIYLANPDEFSSPDTSFSSLLSLILSEVSHLGFESSSIVCPPGFLKDFFEELESDESGSGTRDLILRNVYEELSSRVLDVSILGDFQGPLRIMLYLVMKTRFGAKSLVDHSSWVPEGAGRYVETWSILGAFFHVSALPDSVLETEPHVGQLCFPQPSVTSAATLASSFVDIRHAANNLYSGLKQLLLSMLVNADTHGSVLKFLATAINRNASRAGMQVDPFSCASSGMFVNLSAVMLRLCSPLWHVDLIRTENIDPVYKKIDPNYVILNTRLDFRGLTALHASSEEVAEWAKEIGGSNNNAKFGYITECFFMTARVLNLGLLKAFSELRFIEERLSRLKDLQDEALLEEKKAELDEKFELLSQERLCYIAQIKDSGLLQRALSFYRLMVVWLVDIVGGFKMPLPSTCPREFASLPEHFVDDTMELLIVASRIPKALEGVMLDDFFIFIVMFMASPEYIRNPYLRVKMVKVLNCWISREGGGLSVPTCHKFPLECLVKKLLKLFVDIEFTGSHSSFYDKFNLRHDIAQLLEHMRSVPIHRDSWRQIAKEEEKGICLNFLNLLINDSIYLLDEGLNRIIELKELQAEMSNTVEWERKPAEEKQEKTQHFRSTEKIIRIDMKMANENLNLLAFASELISSPFLLPELVEKVASMLNYFLMQLAGPKRNTLALKDAENYEFRPKQLLKQIVSIYVHLGRDDKDSVFASAITKDGLSYSEELFTDAAVLLKSISENRRLVNDFTELGQRVKDAASVAIDIEAALGEIPEEFMDPISCTLMKDPVILPSGTRVDLSVILRLLLDKTIDPFTRAHLTLDMLIPDSELKGKIEDFVRSKRS